MGQLQVHTLDSIDALRQRAPAWDRLWQRSGVSLPTARAELVAQWLERFAPKATLRVLTVDDGGELVAALPLVGRRLRRLLPAGDLTWNYWSPNGELLLDPQADVPAVCDRLAEAMARLRWPLLWLEMVPLEFTYWQALLAALARRKLAVDVHPRYRIGQVEIRGTFADCQSQWPKSHRRNLRRDLRRLEQTGEVAWRFQSKFTPAEVETGLRRAFEIETRSWKESVGGSVLGTPAIFEFFVRQARQLAEWGSLRLAFLEQAGKPIAFDLGWTAKGVHHSFKVGYDAAYREYAPGQLLRRGLIERLFEEGEIGVLDFQGPMTEGLAVWSTRSYPIARVVVAPGGGVSRSAWLAYKALLPLIRRK